MALARTGTRDADEALRHADRAMYVAKRRGGDGYELFDPTTTEAATSR